MAEMMLNEVVSRAAVLALIEREIARWPDGDPPRWALAVLWGKVRDMEPCAPRMTGFEMGSSSGPAGGKPRKISG